ncbi:inactive peptidyl-prolyl cis-trans isomerase FKBP6-like [Octopus sinensis]|uniref:peptidylprolyl isomerase n=1 Tax=Octopus sinensis TaxID=2607531 RepID=A0A6P7TSL7_9MOLL|nr:inactive peptidyl-prolyl cis-trans isomerase FKBP6-like [Octopus sinensis]
MEGLLNASDNKMELKDAINLSDLRESSEAMFELKKGEIQNDSELQDLEGGDRWNHEDFKNLYNDIAFDNDIITMPYAEQALNMTDISGDGGVRKIKVRSGQGPLVPSDAVVQVHYTGFFEFADEPFDSSRLRGEVFKFRLRKDMVIPGWVIAVTTMQVGELSRFLISPEYGFGDFGCPPRIPQSITALFEIELLSFVEDAGIEDYFQMTEEEKSQIPFDQILKIANMEKSFGTEFFNAKKIRKSYNKYRLALLVLDEYVTCNSEEERQIQGLRLLVLLNMALCCLRLNNATKAITYCQKALAIDKNNAKAFYRLGQAYQMLGKYDEAVTNLKLAQKLRPTDPNVSQQLQKLHSDVLQYKEDEKAMYKKMFCQTTKKSQSSLFPSNRENMVQESDEKVVEVSEEFKENVNKYLKNFLSDNCRSECPMPASSMTVAEIAYVLEMVDDMKLTAVQTGSGENIQIEIRKNRNNTSNNRRVKKRETVWR